jgi:hypothetical protein
MTQKGIAVCVCIRDDGGRVYQDQFECDILFTLSNLADKLPFVQQEARRVFLVE